MTALQRIEPKRELTLDEMASISDVFLKSGYFADAKSQAQAIVKIMAGQELGLAPFAAMAELHVIQGKITMSAGLLAKKVKQSGKYDYKVLEQTEKACGIAIFQEGQPIGESRFTIEDARKAQVKNLDRFPRNMLFARAMSNGVRWYCPDVTGSNNVYVEGEIDDGQVEAEPEPKPRKAKALPEAKPPAIDATPIYNDSIQCAPIEAPVISPDEAKAEAKRNVWEAMKSLNVSTNDAKTIWQHFAESARLCEAFLEFFPRKNPITLNVGECLEIWESVGADLEKAIAASHQFATDKAHRQAAVLREEERQKQTPVAAITGYEAIPEPELPEEDHKWIYPDEEPEPEPTPQQAAFAAQAPSGIIPYNGSLKDDPVGFDPSAFWKWVKFRGLDTHKANHARILQIVQLNSEMHQTRRGTMEAKTNWEAVIHQVKTEFSS